MKTFLVVAQYEENYAYHDWDGKGDCPQYWKKKGGNEYVVTASTAEQAYSLVTPFLNDDNYSRSYITHMKEVAPDYQTESELDQLEYEGRIIYPAERIGA
jgi:hypothetical protein